VAVLAAGAAYIWAVRKASSPSARISRARQKRSIAFGAALLTILVALTGPIERFSDDLFWVHMLQHVLLLTVAAPLLVLATPWMLALRQLPSGTQRRAVAWWRGQRSQPVGRLLALMVSPAAVWVLFNANLLAWHLPALFDATLRNEYAHDLEHLLFLGLGVLFWAQLIHSPLLRTRLSDLQRVLFLSAAATVGWALSIALSLARSPLYTSYAQLQTRPGGLSALADQRIAASVMLVPGSITFLIAILVFVNRWLAADEPRVAGAGSTQVVFETQERSA
jgi:cytochrome c oxidase assembly factor CtaG